MIPEEIQEFDKNKSWELGQRIQKERLKKEISAADLAEYMGIRANQLSRIENGRANCTLPQLFVLSQILECSADYLLTGKKTSSKYTPEQERCIDALVNSFA